MVSIVDYGMGNLYSIKKRIEKAKFECEITNDPNVISKSQKIILPGVGHFGKAMQNLKKYNLIDVLNNEVVIRKKPVLGICLGMQLFSSSSEEGNVEGLNWIESSTVRFKIEDRLKYKVPHIGWNSIVNTKESVLFEGIPDGAQFYFVHSFHISCIHEEDTLNETDYQYKFTSAVQKENIYGVQYHPEKSHDIGNKLLTNFLNV